jgi:hypothetical protein
VIIHHGEGAEVHTLQRDRSQYPGVEQARDGGTYKVPCEEGEREEDDRGEREAAPVPLPQSRMIPELGRHLHDLVHLV